MLMVEPMSDCIIVPALLIVFLKFRQNTLDGDACLFLVIIESIAFYGKNSHSKHH